MKLTSVVHELPPPRTGRCGRPRTRGARLGTPTDLAARATAGARWRDTRVRRNGRTDTVQITEIDGPAAEGGSGLSKVDREAAVLVRH